MSFLHSFIFLVVHFYQIPKLRVYIFMMDAIGILHVQIVTIQLLLVRFHQSNTVFKLKIARLKDKLDRVCALSGTHLFDEIEMVKARNRRVQAARLSDLQQLLDLSESVVNSAGFFSDFWLFSSSIAGSLRFCFDFGIIPVVCFRIFSKVQLLLLYWLQVLLYQEFCQSILDY